MISRFGDAALLVELDGPDAAQALARSLRARPLAGVIDTVPGLASLLVELDPLHADIDSLATALDERAAAPDARIETDARVRSIPVVYGGEHGPDLAEVAALCGSTPRLVAEVHAAADLRVLFDGFAPGFAYIGSLPEGLRVPRLATPRTRTPAGSVAVAGDMTGIYPAALPGGWRIIGRTPRVTFDPSRTPPAYLVPGDHVRFVPISADAWDRHAGAADDW